MDVTLKLLSISASPGDFNSDGVVDGHDFLMWQLGGSPDPLSASDLLDWQNNDGADSFAGAAVPEPTSARLIVLLRLTISCRPIASVACTKGR
jgi:hypothetical protein